MWIAALPILNARHKQEKKKIVRTERINLSQVAVCEISCGSLFKTADPLAEMKINDSSERKMLFYGKWLKFQAFTLWPCCDFSSSQRDGVVVFVCVSGSGHSNCAGEGDLGKARLSLGGTYVQDLCERTCNVKQLCGDEAQSNHSSEQRLIK